MVDPDDNGRPIALGNKPSFHSDENSTLIPMLVGGLALMIVGGLIVVAFVFASG